MRACMYALHACAKHVHSITEHRVVLHIEHGRGRPHPATFMWHVGDVNVIGCNAYVCWCVGAGHRASARLAASASAMDHNHSAFAER